MTLSRTASPRLLLASALILLVLPAAQATEPVVLRAPAWSFEGGQPGASLGVVAGLGDVNGDGFADFAVGAPSFDNGQTNEGAVYVFHGSAAGPGTLPALILEGQVAGSAFGQSLAGAGDVNGDGFDDLVVGAPSFDAAFGEDEGAAYVFRGSPTGIQPTAVWSVVGEEIATEYGHAVASAGDVNGDGFDDLIVGAPIASDDEAGLGAMGRAYLYLGSASGLATSPAWVRQGDDTFQFFGDDVGTAGDVDGDGYDDVVVGVPGFNAGVALEGKLVLFHGSEAGLDSSPAWFDSGNEWRYQLGMSVGTAGDLNGDGYADILGGGGYYDGYAQAYLGSPLGVLTSSAWIVENVDNGNYGYPLEAAGDVNGDGYDDIVVGEAACCIPVQGGVAHVYLGSATGLPASKLPAWRTGGPAIFQFGRDVAGAGDVNGDGFDDVLAGARGYSNGLSGEGGAFLYLGCADGDGDGVCTTSDNCAAVPNVTQGNLDGDASGDGCDCSMTNPDVWALPGEARDLTVALGPGCREHAVLVRAHEPRGGRGAELRSAALVLGRGLRGSDVSVAAGPGAAERFRRRGPRGGAVPLLPRPGPHGLRRAARPLGLRLDRAAPPGARVSLRKEADAPPVGRRGPAPPGDGERGRGGAGTTDATPGRNSPDRGPVVGTTAADQARPPSRALRPSR